MFPVFQENEEMPVRYWPDDSTIDQMIVQRISLVENTCTLKLFLREWKAIPRKLCVGLEDYEENPGY